MTDDVLAGHAGVPKSAIVGMLNLAAHEYHRVDEEFVWGTVDHDLPPLCDAVRGEFQQRGC